MDKGSKTEGLILTVVLRYVWHLPDVFKGLRLWLGQRIGGWRLRHLHLHLSVRILRRRLQARSYR